MSAAFISDAQLIDLVKQLPPERKRNVLLALASEPQLRRDERLQMAENKMRALCAGRGLNWDALSEAEREAFIDDLLHEDRPCAK
ncbi:MAG: hypothetical protein L0Y71_00525 [Gemmataceae bacterium]|nr:hypothetical protein [Gemmataceae bacterium]